MSVVFSWTWHIYCNVLLLIWNFGTWSSRDLKLGKLTFPVRGNFGTWGLQKLFQGIPFGIGVILMFPSLYVPCPMFSSIYVPQSLCSPNLCSPIPMLPGPMFPDPNVPQYRCFPIPMFPDTYVPRVFVGGGGSGGMRSVGTIYWPKIDDLLTFSRWSTLEDLFRSLFDKKVCRPIPIPNCVQ